ncbi:MAG: ABC transporter substrate-binding protein [Chloroflexi bacterium]|nr:ABC transporter substrate-binding protein [Chloroflexota bacterium]
MLAKRLYSMLCGLLILAVFAACSPGGIAPVTGGDPTTAAQQGAQTGEGQTLRVWITWGDNPAQLQGLFDQYGEANNVTVEVTAPVEEDKVLAALTGSDPPDVLILSGGDLVKSWAREGLITSLDNIIQENNIDIDDIFPAPLEQCRDEGRILCLPWGTDLYALFWNKDLFEDAGLDPERPPATMEELVEFADRLTVTDENGNLSQIGFIPDFSWSHSDLYTRMFGGFWYSDDGQQLTVNSQPMIDSLRWQQQFYQKYGVDNVLAFTSALGGYMSPDQGFYAGKIAMMVDGEWQTGPNFISQFKPELNYGVAPFPPPADHMDRANTVVAQGTVAVIPSNVADEQASAKLLAWMMSPEIVAEEMAANYNLPTSREAAKDPRFLENPKFKVFMDLMSSPNAYPLITSPISSQLNETLGQIEEQVLHAGADPEPLLEEAQQQFEPMLQESLQP